MFDNKIMKVIGKLLVAGLIIYAVVLLLDEKWRLNYFTQPKQNYVTAEVDSAVEVRQLNPILSVEEEDTVYTPPTLTTLVAKVDSDSIKRYDLHRDLQEVVTIDMEEHKEAVFFTWDDVKAYFGVLLDYYKNYKNKKTNENN